MGISKVGTDIRSCSNKIHLELIIMRKKYRHIHQFSISQVSRISFAAISCKTSDVDKRVSRMVTIITNYIDFELSFDKNHV